MSQIKLGIVGSGMIAGVIAKAVKQVDNIELIAVASRRQTSAQSFADDHQIAKIFETWQEMLASDAINAVYIATPTAVKEEIAIYGSNNNKHLLVDKPFSSLKSVERMIEAATQNNVAFMDATHFSNNSRTQQIKDQINSSIGQPKVVRSSFFFPFMDRSNIRFNPDKEPTGAVGDMAWYSMRAIAEYLQPEMAIKKVVGDIIRDEETGAVIRGSGMISFIDGKSSTFDFGYDAGVCLMDLDILGHNGMFHISDFVLDWKNGFAFDNKKHVNGYTKRVGMAQPNGFKFVAADTEPQAVTMMKNFAMAIQDPTFESSRYATLLSLKTQELLDAYWSQVI